MNMSSPAIFIHRKKYLNNGIFIFYTQNHGLIEFFVNTNYKNKRLNHVKPLSMVTLSFSSKNSYFKYIDHELSYVMNSAYEDIYKSCVVFFLADFIHSVCKKNDININFFDFLKTSIMILEETNNSVSNFHICFMIKSMKFLGIEPLLNKNHKYLDLKEGVSTNKKPGHLKYIDKKAKKLITDFNKCKLSKCHDIKFSRNERKIILNNVIVFYGLHLENIKKIHSHEILEEVLN